MASLSYALSARRLYGVHLPLSVDHSTFRHPPDPPPAQRRVSRSVDFCPQAASLHLHHFDALELAHTATSHSPALPIPNPSSPYTGHAPIPGARVLQFRGVPRSIISSSSATRRKQDLGVGNTRAICISIYSDTYPHPMLEPRIHPAESPSSRAEQGCPSRTPR